MAPEDASLQVNLDPQVDEGQIERVLREVQNAFGDSPIELNVTGGGSGGTAGGGGGAGGKGAKGMLSGMLGSLGSITTMLTSIVGAAAIISTIMTQFKPLVNMINMIMKLLVEFLRPVAEMLMLLLMPVLAILKPILTVFRTMMQPFRKAAFQLSGEAMKRFAKGDIAGGLALSLSSVQVLLTGLNAMIWKLLTDFLNLLLQGLAQLSRVILLPLIGMQAAITPGVSFEELWNQVGAVLGNTIDFVTAQIQNLAGGLVMGQLANIDSLLTGLLGEAGDKMLNLQEMGEALEGIFSQATVNFSELGATIEQMTSPIEKLQTIASDLFDTLTKDTQALLDIISGIRNDDLPDDPNLFQEYANGIREINSAVTEAEMAFGEDNMTPIPEDMQLPAGGFTGLPGGGRGDRIGPGGGRGEDEGFGIMSTLEKGYNIIKDATKTFFGQGGGGEGYANIYKSFFNLLTKITTNLLGEDGSLTKLINDALNLYKNAFRHTFENIAKEFTNLREATNEFVSEMENAASRIEDAADKINSSTSDMGGGGGGGLSHRSSSRKQGGH